MSGPFIVNAHAHVGLPGMFFSPQSAAADLLRSMDRLAVRSAILAGDAITLAEGASGGMSALHRAGKNRKGVCITWGFSIREAPRTACTS